MKQKLKGYIETLGNPGNLYATAGSRLWAIAVRSEMQSLWHDAKFNAQQLKSWRDLMTRHAGYSQLVDKDGKAFGSYKDFCQAKPPFGLGCAPSDIDQIIQKLELVDAKTFEVEDALGCARPAGANCWQLIKSLDSEQLRKIHKIIGELLSQESASVERPLV